MKKLNPEQLDKLTEELETVIRQSEDYQLDDDYNEVAIISPHMAAANVVSYLIREELINTEPCKTAE